MAGPLRTNVILLLAWMLAAAGPARSDDGMLVCKLQRSGPEFRGSCSVPCQVNALAVDIDGVRKGFSCAEPPRRVNATLRKSEGVDNWLGTMEGKHSEDPTRFSVIDSAGGISGVAKTPFGWFALRSTARDGDVLTLLIAVEKQLPPTRADIQIIQRALDLVSDLDAWNKQDDRQCPPKPQKWSVFCALMQATEEISGGVHYRQPALQAVREVLNEVGGNRLNKHRLMDYNNHPETSLEDIHNLLRLSRTRLEGRFR